MTVVKYQQVNKFELGDLIKDKITGFMGIAVSRTEWINRCVRYSIQPRELQEGKPVEAQWFDEEQIILVQAGVVTIDKELTGGPQKNEVSRPTDPKR